MFARDVRRRASDEVKYSARDDDFTIVITSISQENLPEVLARLDAVFSVETEGE
jgi:hypothetical protein